MLSRITDEDLARWEALAQEVMRVSPYSTEYAVASGDLADEALPALVAEVRRLRRLETWIERFVAFEPAAEVPSQNDVALAIRIERMAVLRELRLLLEQRG